MISRHRLAEAAALLGDAARAGIVTALWDGRARPAGELARIAGVAPATASGHLAKLVAGGVLRVQPQGRHRYYRLADALESLARLLPPRDAGAAEPVTPLRRARLCYDHLAGQLGVTIADGLVARGWLRLDHDAWTLLPLGRRGFARFGVDVDGLERGRRPLLRSCIDWTERREHLGGALGAAFAMHLFERDWLRSERGSRAVLVTTAGRQALRQVLGVAIP
jgi:DNA-binding transcriptional ArsR family regulator